MNTFLKLKKQMGHLKILWMSWTRVDHCKCTSSEAFGTGPLTCQLCQYKISPGLDASANTVLIFITQLSAIPDSDYSITELCGQILLYSDH